MNYTVTNARVGQITDYDKLTLEVWTDGSVEPEEAVAYAAKILKDQLSIFIVFEEEEEEEMAVSGEQEEGGHSTKISSGVWMNWNSLSGLQTV